MTHAQPTLSLEGQVALITGGSRGIGAAAVRMFVQAGARVVFNYVRAKDAADKLVQECGPDVCHAVQADLNGTAGAEGLVRAAVERFGSLDAVVVNHGIWSAEEIDVDKMTDEHWRTTIATNLDSAFAVVKHAVAQIKQQDRGGNVVLVSSTAGQRGEAGHCDYAATKGALISMTKGLSTELAPHRHSRELRRARLGRDRHDHRRAGRRRAPQENLRHHSLSAASARPKKLPRRSSSCVRNTPASSPAKCST